MKLRNWKSLSIWGGLLLFVGLALADNNVLNKGSYFQNATNGAKVDGSGNAYVTESAPAMDANLTFASIISSASLAAGAADSSAVLDTHRMRLGMLLIKCTPISITGADSLSGIRLSVQIRTHLNGQTDSSSTFVFYPYGQSAMGAVTTVASQIDTLLTGQIQTGLNLQANVNGSWSGEFTCYFANNRVGPGTSVIGSMGQRTFYYPNGIAVPVQSIWGREIYSPYTSIRVRNLGSGPTTARACAVTVHLVGTPL